MEEYIKVDVVKYVNNGLNNGILIPRRAEKYARILARHGVEDEQIITWSVDSDGKEIIEKISKVKENDWVVTKANENGNPEVDKNNHVNEWIVDDVTFKKKYELDSSNPYLYRPKSGIQVFVEIPDNIILNQWDTNMKIARGGYINITNENDMYGISKRDFEDTYKFCEEIKRTNQR